MDDESEDRTRQAVARLLRASIDFTRAYEAWAVAPQDWQQRSALDDAERRLDEAQHEAVKREAMARAAHRGSALSAPAHQGDREPG